MSLIKSSLTIGLYTLISRVLGFVRDITIAWGLGASYLSDAFLVAFKLPNFLRRLFAEGAFNAAFVPMFSSMLTTDGKTHARDFASAAMSFLLFILLIVTLVCILAMPWLMHILAPGFIDNPVKYDLTVTLTRITMPYIIFISLVSLLGGILNSNGKFAAVAATPILMNLSLICVPYFLGDIPPTAAHSLAIAVFVAGVVQWLWLVYFCRKEGLLPRFQWPKLTPEVKKLLLLIGPAALGAGVAQINLFVDLIIASQFDGGVSYLYYADRINELPLAVIGIAVGTVLLPMLSKQISAGDMEAAYKSQNHAIAFSLFLSLPAACAIITLAEPIIRIMFVRGEFSLHDAAATFPALMMFAAGLPAFILIKILAPCFFSQSDTKTPFKIAALCIVANIILNLLLMGPLEHVGMALATTLSGWLNVALMLYVLRKRHWIRLQPSLFTQLTKITLAVGLMCGLLYWLLDIGDGYLAGDTFTRFGTLIGISAAGAAAYFIAAMGLNILNCRNKLLLWWKA